VGEGILVGSLTSTASTVTSTSGTLTSTSGTISDVTIKGNTVIANDRGNPTGAVISDSPYAQCNAMGVEPGDCGEGIHLLSADDSTVMDNYVTGNSGGILLTDENGPTYGNLIQGNDTFANAYDCGITLAGHQVGTTTNGTTWSTVLPSVGGIYDNTVRGNRSTDNGVLGQGGGILMATGAPGGAVYDNVVEYNYVAGNGLSGVTVHSHSPGEDLNGNVIKGNVIGTNNLDGDFDFSPLVDASTTGVFVATAVNPISITIVGNRIEYNYYGIWMTPGVTATTTPPNTFVGVTTPIFTAS
jgi:parallel beta-helix repeat protein